MLRKSLYDYCIENNRTELLAQWDTAANLPLTPTSVTCGSSRKIWWQCNEGHVWQAPIYRRCYLHSGCPVCSGNVSKKKLERYKRMMQDSQAELERKMRDQSDTLKAESKKL